MLIHSENDGVCCIRGYILLFFLALVSSRSLGQAQVPVIASTVRANTTVVANLSPRRRLSQYAHTAWTAKDGIPPPIRAIAQTPDGYLWLASGTGLYRFDGIRFVAWESLSSESLPSTTIWSLNVSPDGSLWIGFAAGGASRLHAGVLTNFLPGKGIPNGGVQSIASSPDGTVWFACQYGFARYVEGRWENIGTTLRYPATAAQRVFVDHKGTLWVVTEGSDFKNSSDPVRPNTVLYLNAHASQFERKGLALRQVWDLASHRTEACGLPTLRVTN